jgi:hypothetical protein
MPKTITPGPQKRGPKVIVKKPVVTTTPEQWEDKSFWEKLTTTYSEGFPTIRRIYGNKK